MNLSKAIDKNRLIASKIRIPNHRVSKGLESLASEMGIPNQRKRSPEKSREINRKWNDLSTIQHDLSGIRPIYAPRDLYDACKSAVDESHSSENSDSFLVPSGEMPARKRFECFSYCFNFNFEIDLKIIYSKIKYKLLNPISSIFVSQKKTPESIPQGHI